MTRRAAILVLLAVLGAGAEPFDPGQMLPPAWTGAVLLRLDFEAAADPVPGVFGHGRRLTAGQPLELNEPPFSADRPLTIMCWWRLPEPRRDQAFALLGLRGAGTAFIHVLAREEGFGGTPHASLFLQAYNLAGNQNVDAFLDRDPFTHLDLPSRTWHHVALVTRAARVVEVYVDGRRIAAYTLVGSGLQPAHALTRLTVGALYPEGWADLDVDEFIILTRAASPADVAAYTAAVRTMMGD